MDSAAHFGALSSCLGGEWWEFRHPFRHLRAFNVLTVAEYEAIASKFRQILETTTEQRDGPHRLRKSNPKYDAEILAIDHALAQEFPIFFAKDTLRLLATSIGIPFVPRVDAALHSSPPASKTGWIHTDFCSAWFDESVGADVGPIRFPSRDRCDYFTGRARAKESSPKEYVRAGTIIYYLCNDDWSTGDGGETGLYNSPKETSRTTVEFVPPLNNTLLFFPCSPHSYHRFIANPHRRRNSLIVWLHYTVEHAQSRWGEAVRRR